MRIPKHIFEKYAVQFGQNPELCEALVQDCADVCRKEFSNYITARSEMQALAALKCLDVILSRYDLRIKPTEQK